MIPCSGCNRHLRATDATCPFCSTRVSVAGRAFQAVGGAVTALVLAACYGSPPGSYLPKDTGPETGATDIDMDGYDADVDCDDADAAVNPGATEVCDDTLDNDCDTAIDAADTDCAAR